MLSNALEKSIAKTRTNGLADSMVHMVCRRAIRAAVVDPVGLKAYWSAKHN